MIKYQLVFFDIDGTLYDLKDVESMNYDIQAMFIQEELGFTHEEILKLFEKNGIYKNRSEKSQSATELFLSMGISRSRWNWFREEHFDVTCINRRLAVTNQIMSDFGQMCDMVALSSNSYNNLVKIMEWIEVDKEQFSDFICSDKCYGNNEFNKKNQMSMCLERKGLQANTSLSIGDRFNTDIKPILELGGDGIIISKPAKLENVLSDFRFGLLKNCKEYSFYKSAIL